MPFNMVKSKGRVMQFKVKASGPVHAIPMATKLCLLLLFQVIGIVHNRITVIGNRSTKLY